jgi:hypothetical protein
MMSESLEDILNKLKETGNAIQLDNIDPLWDIPNQFVNSIEMLLIILTKTSSIPFIPDFTEEPIYTGLGINLEQAKLIQESNNTLLQLHTSTIKYCVQQYTIASYIKNMMDTIILQIPETDMSGLIDFITNYKLNSNMDTNSQNGGQPVTNKLIPMLFMIMCLIQIVLPSEIVSTSLQLPSTSLQLISSENLEQFQKGIISFSENTFVSDLFQKSEITSGPINMNTVVQKYDQQIKDETSGFIGSALSFFNTPEDGQTVLQNTVQDFNTKSRNFSEGVENSCIDLMEMAKDQGVFAKWQSLDSLKETTDKLEAIGLSVMEQNNNLQADIVGNAVGAIASAAVVPITGDTATPLAFLANTVNGIWGSIKSTQTSIKETKEALQQQPNQLSETEQMALEENMFTFSNLYCSFGYNLQLELQGTTITVIGDKIEYMSMINIINSLEKNIAAQKTNAVFTGGNEQQNKNSIQILESLHQRLDVLKAITNSLNNIVNFSFKIEMLKLARFASPTNMAEFQTFLTNQLANLNIMLTNLKKQFPKREADLQLQKKQAEEEAELNMFEAEIEDFERNIQAAETQQNAERTARQLGNWWIATETVVQGWVDIGLNASEFGKQNLGKTIASLADFGAEGPLALFRSLLKFVNTMLLELLLSPTGWVAIIGALLCIQFAFGGVTGTIKIFKKGGDLFLAIFWGGILFVYKLIKTPFGYIYKQIATICVTNPDDVLNPNDDLNPNTDVLQIQDDRELANRAAYDRIKEAEGGPEEGEEYDPDADYVEIEKKRLFKGGKRLEGKRLEGKRLKSGKRKTRKHKKKRTHKQNGRKRRQTKYRKGRPTKKR